MGEGEGLNDSSSIRFRSIEEQNFKRSSGDHDQSLEYEFRND
jgi:hypothetical protein